MGIRRLNLQRAALEDHQRSGKRLIPPFAQFGPPPEQVFWWRDLLPEFLWIDSLVQAYGEPGAVNIFKAFISAVDEYNPHPTNVLDGTISSFKLIGADRRQSLRTGVAKLVRDAVVSPFGNILSLYPDCPMAWMQDASPATSVPNALAQIRSAIERLLPGKDSHTGFCRALPLHRLLAHGRIKIFADLTETIEAIRTYPQGDRYRAECFARSAHNQILLSRARDDPAAFGWSRYFWNRNRSLTPCVYE